MGVASVHFRRRVGFNSIDPIEGTETKSLQDDLFGDDRLQ